MARIGIGIDLGTTYSLVAVVDHGKPRVLTVDGEGRVPSAVFYGDDIKAGALVGFEATAAAQQKSGALLTSTKRFMGRGRSDAARFLKDGARTYVLHTGGDERHVEFVVPDGDGGTRTSSPVEVAAYVLKNLKDRAEAELCPGAEIKDAVVTVPAYFDEAQRQATRDAGRLAGLNVLRLVAEPTAAALAYGLDKEASGRGQGTYVVFDLGGGTFDVSVLEFDRGLFRVRATAGDTALGGDDFDWPIAQRVLLAAGLTQQAAQPQQVHQALRMARHAKELLTTKDSVDVEGVLPMLDGTVQPVAFTLTRQELDALILPVVNRCADPCERALRDAGITPEQLHGVILVGGSTRVPLVRAFARTFFGREPLIDAHPDEVVAAGAALQADLLVGGATDALLLDVTPLSLGLETMGGVVDKLIPRNSPIPCSATHTFTTYVDGQTAMDIHVVQGERERVDHNKSLARFRLRGIPPLGAGLARVAVTFQLDADGLLTVTAKEQATGLVQTVEVKPSYGLTDGEVEELLMASFDNAERDMEERMLIEKRVDARRIVQVTESALDEDGDAMLTGPERAAIVTAMEAVHTAMAGTDRHAIAAATDALDAATQEFARRRMSKRISEALEHHNIDTVLDDARTGALR